MVSGGNIDVNILERGHRPVGSITSRAADSTLTIALTDKPGQLVGVSTVISRCGGNVVAVHHDNGDPNMAINSCFLKVVTGNQRQRTGRIDQASVRRRRIPAGQRTSLDNNILTSERSELQGRIYARKPSEQWERVVFIVLKNSRKEKSLALLPLSGCLILL